MPPRKTSRKPPKRKTAGGARPKHSTRGIRLHQLGVIRQADRGQMRRMGVTPTKKQVDQLAGLLGRRVGREVRRQTMAALRQKLPGIVKKIKIPSTRKGAPKTARPSTPHLPQKRRPPIIPKKTGTIRTPPSFVPTVAGITTQPALSLERAVEWRNIVHRKEVEPPKRFPFLSWLMRRTGKKMESKKTKVTTLERKAAGAGVGIAASKGKLFGTQWGFRLFWTARKKFFDWRIKVNNETLTALEQYSQSTAKEYERKMDVVRIKQTTQLQGVRAGYEAAQREVARLLPQIHQDFERKITEFPRTHRVGYLEMKNLDRRLDQRMRQMMLNVRTIRNEGRAIQWEIFYRMMLNDLRQGKYDSALGWLLEMEKLTRKPK